MSGPEGPEGRALPEVVEAGPEDFDAVVMGARGVLVVVDLWGPRCPNCEVFDRALGGLLEELRGAPVKIVQANVYAAPELATRFGVHGIPTFLLVRDGRLIGRMTSFKGAAFWLGVVRDHLPGGAKAPVGA